MNGVKLLAFLICWFLCVSAQGAEPFKFRGYYVTFMRMPVMGLPEWKEAIDCFAEDDINVLILWTAGGFRSKKFPLTVEWEFSCKSLIILVGYAPNCAFQGRNLRNSHYLPTNCGNFRKSIAAGVLGAGMDARGDRETGSYRTAFSATQSVSNPWG